MTGRIFNIQKFSLHDGPGIRTTVFFKGCNLRCSWCANPESQQIALQLTLDAEKCLGCGRCVQACAAGARRMNGSLPAVNGEVCTHCGACMAECPAGAIGREGREAELAEIIEEVMKDKPFYDQSGGGVTFSGGEVLLQQEFAAELARELHSRGVSVAVETAAAVPPDRFRAFLKEIDYVFVDLKHHDNGLHRKYTGVGNADILENIRAVAESGLSFTVRIPVIPGCNDGMEDARRFAQLLLSMGIDRVQLLPFHQLGERKYALLGREYAFSGEKQLHGEELAGYMSIFEDCGVHAEL